MKAPLVSIIMPAYNASAYIADAIGSVLDQRYAHLELLIVNDGSTDQTEEVIRAFTDSRVRYFTQPNQGVSAARNLALKEMKGDFFCFLDADDRLPGSSIGSRLNLFLDNPELEFADGAVQKMDAAMRQIKSTWKPDWKGNPLSDLIGLSGRSFFGLSWMVRRRKELSYQFVHGLSHGEDLLFFMHLARSGGDYAYTGEVVYRYRMHDTSAMADIDGLASGYKALEKELSTWPEVSIGQLQVFRQRYRSILWKSYLREFQVTKAFKYYF